MGIKSAGRKKARQTSLKSGSKSRLNYSKFDQIDGSHPWQEVLPEGCVFYPVRRLKEGKVSYFNFALAKEMGLISRNHPHELTGGLKEKILETFSLQIINEYDQEKKTEFDSHLIKDNLYMATRYLQLQHQNKKGMTSGDGRGIWNGIVKHNGKIWDVSSRGTGVTKLAPGSVEAKKNLKTGSAEVGYGCGLAEIDELYGCALMSEIFHNQGIVTERMLAIVDLGNGVGIGVRAAPNLFRPAHLFLYLKQENYDSLKKATDFFIERQVQNGDFNYQSDDRTRYKDLLKYLCESFAKFTARLEVDYIFAWLDWDGDNVLMSGGIIDYGSVRQFGLRHDQYRYDDVDRFSTTLTEQKGKARQIVQTFIQMIDFINSKKKKPIGHFQKHRVLNLFNEVFEVEKRDRFLYHMGFNREQRQKLVKENSDLINKFYKKFSYFEKAKTLSKSKKIDDGVNRPAIFNMRNIMRRIPEELILYADQWDDFLIPEKEFLSEILSEYATSRDKKFSEAQKQCAKEFQQYYKKLIEAASDGKSLKSTLSQLMERTALINREDRMTGNGLITIVDEILKCRKKSLSDQSIQRMMEQFIYHQSAFPETGIELPHKAPRGNGRELFDRMLKIVKDYSEDI